MRLFYFREVFSFLNAGYIASNVVVFLEKYFRHIVSSRKVTCA